MSQNRTLILVGVLWLLVHGLQTVRAGAGPYDRQVAAQQVRLAGPLPEQRANAAAALGFLRAYQAAEALAQALRDEAPAVRRQAALSLGWCGGRAQVPALLGALDDADWTVRQSAWVALTNLTGMEFPFDAFKPDPQPWRTWWATVPADRPPREVLALIDVTAARLNIAAGCAVTATSVYKGPPSAVTDGDATTFWQTKNVTFPQACTLDLGATQQVGCVVVEQYAAGYCLTEATVALSEDGRQYREAWRAGQATPVRLVASFAPRRARFVRLTASGNERPGYPTTLREIEVYAAGPPTSRTDLAGLERAARALGALGGRDASEAVLAVLLPYRPRASVTPEEAVLVQVALRSLGRLRDPAAFPVLAAFLDNPRWARYAAEALADFGDARAAPELLARYPLYARDLAGKEPQRVPPDDRPGFESLDRMYETPFQIASALARLPVPRAELAKLAPLILANLPSDFDGAVLYEPEACQLITAHLLREAGLFEAARDTALAQFGVAAPAHEAFAALAKRRHVVLPLAAQWLPMLGAAPELLEHTNGWVRINAAKAMMFAGATNTADRIAQLLAESKPEAAYGYFGGFLFTKSAQGQDEHNDPPPRWREAFTRALGRLGGARHVSLLTMLLDDERNALEIQYAAAVALAELGSAEALAALREAEAKHPFHSVRLVAREALWQRNVPPAEQATAARPEPRAPAGKAGGIVFIKGPNRMPNRFQIDAWRQAYSTTDSGPTYRLGWNLFVLREGKATPLTGFADGWVADCEVSADGACVLFARRGGENDPWWHLWQIHADGTGLRQLTRGPYHDVQPNFLNDGRIVFASTRIGMRDEYHGYPATGLTVMNPDGSDIHCIGFNLGRDNEPALLPDGRIVFSRLDLFYSRLKTELTLQAVFPDGTKNVTLYGPERRAFWRQATIHEKGWGEAPSRHRVLRLTQPQAFDGERVLVATSAGLALVGPGRYREAFVPHDKGLAVTTPFPLGDGRILCAAVEKEGAREEGNLGLYELDAATGRMTLLYLDPAAASFEARPLRERSVGPVLPDAPQARSRAYTAQLLCGSVKVSQLPLVASRGRLVRVIEGQPIVARHATHNSRGTEAWKNHVGTAARILGTVPLAADGSFNLEVPADRLMHLQVLDSDRRVVGNQLVWMYGRPGETRSCVGCHEAPNTTSPQAVAPVAARVAPVQALPTGGEFLYRAKAWQKGELLESTEERTRTAGAVNLLGRQ